MAHSEMQKEVINLGKLLVKELGLEPGSDTLSRWMAHYLAEKIKLCESSEGEEKAKIEQECFNLILKLWKHRWTLPNGRRPLEDFEPLLNLLQRIKPEHEEPYWYPTIPIPHNHRDEKEPPAENTVQFWIDVADQIDIIARTWMWDAFQRAAAIAETPDTKKWLETAVGYPDDYDRRAIRIVYADEDANLTEEQRLLDFHTKYKIEKLNNRIANLERFAKLNEFLITDYKQQLEQIQKGE